MRGDRLGNVAKRVELLRSEDVGEAVPHRGRVARGRGFDGGHAGVGQYDVEAAAVFGA